MRFDALPLHDVTKTALEAMGFEETTPVQEQTLPPLLEGRDMVAQAQTGTGKTAAFGIPLVEAARTGRRGIVLTPTRELARQVQRELQAIAHGSPVDVVCLIGGASFGDQVKAIKRHPDAIFVATPGRVVDHLQRGTLHLDRMGILVLDEADEMLSMGFQEEVDRIVDAIPRERQTMLFSATLPPAIEALAKRALSDPVTVRAGSGGAATTVKQHFALVPGRERPDAVRRIIAAHDPAAALLFCKTRMRVDDLADALRDAGAEALHGGMNQAQRDAVMERLRGGQTRLLVATDVAARGLDVEDVELVLHDEPPTDVDTYIHRIGRTGRAGRHGRSILFLPPGRMGRLRELQRVVGKLEKYEVPDQAVLARIRAKRIVAALGEIDPGTVGDEALQLALKQGLDVDQVARRALEYLLAADEAPEAAQPSSEPVALALKVGAIDHVHPGAIVGVLCNVGGLRAEDIGRIDILDKMSVVEVPGHEVERLCHALGNALLSGRKLLPRPAEDWRFKQARR